MGPSKWDLDDTIAALATAPGSGGRAIVRLSGPGAFEVCSKVFQASQAAVGPACRALPPGSLGRALLEGHISLPGLPPLPADLYLWPGPASYTGQNVAELHTLSSPPLIDLLVADLLKAGA